MVVQVIMRTDGNGNECIRRDPDSDPDNDIDTGSKTIPISMAQHDPNDVAVAVAMKRSGNPICGWYGSGFSITLVVPADCNTLVPQ